MKKILITTSVLIILGIFLSIQHLQSKSNGNIISYTGAPKATTGVESTCINCHGGAINTGPHSLSISVAGNPAGFIPGQTYSITAKILNVTGTRAGFSMVCLDPVRANCGTFTNGTGTRILTAGGRNYINHSGSTLKSWTFSWNAPTANVPDSVTFYMASLEVIGATDNTYTGKFVFHKDNTVTGISNSQKTNGLMLFPNPAVNQIRFSAGPVNYQIWSLAGTPVKEGRAESGESISLEGIPSGKYFWQAEGENNRQSGQLLIQP